MSDVKTKYNEEDLQEFKEIINNKIARAEQDLASLKAAYKNDGEGGTTDDGPVFEVINRPYGRAITLIKCGEVNNTNKQQVDG